GRAQQLSSEARGLGDDDFDRNALDRDAEGAARPALEQRDDCRQPRKLLENALCIVGAADNGEVERRVGPAARIAGDLTAELVGDLLEQRTGTVERQALPLRLLRPVEPFEQAPLGLWPDPRDRG